MSLERVGHERLARRDEDNIALGFLQLLERRAAGVETAQQVNVNHRLEAVGADLFSGQREVAGGPADQGMDRPEFLAATLHGRFQRRVVAHVGGMGGDPRAERPQFRPRRIEFFLRPAHDAEIRPNRREVAGDAKVDAAAAAGDEDGFALEQVFGEIGDDVHGAILSWVGEVNRSSLSKIR